MHSHEHHRRLLNLLMITLAMILPYAFIHYLDYRKHFWRVGGVSRSRLQSALFRKFMNYCETVRNTVRDGDMVVKRAIDRSGRSNFATMHRNPPKFNPRAVNGLGAMEFAGGEVLKTLPFAQPLQQPITLVVVARARGDTTMVDSLTPQCAAARPRTSARAAQFCAILRVDRALGPRSAADS